MSEKIGILISSGSRFSLLQQHIAADHLMGAEYELAVVCLENAQGDIARRVRDWGGKDVYVIVTVDDDGALARYVRGLTLLPVVAARTDGHGESVSAALDHAVRILALHSFRYRNILEAHVLVRRKQVQREDAEMQERIRALGRAHNEIDPKPPNGKSSAAQATSASESTQLTRDEKTLEQLASQFHPRIVTEHRKSELPAQPKALDYSPALREVITVAKEIANAYGHSVVTAEHFLAAIIDTDTCAAHVVLKDCGADFDRLAAGVAKEFPPGSEDESAHFILGESAISMIQHAKQVARRTDRPCLTTLDILWALMETSNTGLGNLVAESGVTIADAAAAIGRLKSPDECAEFLAQKAKPREPELPPEWHATEAADLERRLAEVKVPEVAEVTPVPAKPPADAEQKTIVACDPQNPPLDVVENACDLLLEGKIIALPTESGYYVVVDATNPVAVNALYELKQQPREKPVQVLIHSTNLLKTIVRNVPRHVELALERFWPGPLVVIFDRHARAFRSLAQSDTLAVRIPDHYTALAVLSMVGRPLAAVSATRRRRDSATALEVEKQLKGEVDLILDSGKISPMAKPTVISVAAADDAAGREPETVRLLREGTVNKKALQKVFAKVENWTGE